jgi:hypothetical protein
MGTRHLETLHIDPERVSSAAAFLSGYAEFCLQERRESGDRSRRDPDAVTEDQRTQRGWNLIVEAASSLVEAGQWAMLVDPVNALAMWTKAGRLYREVDFGFGYYLSVIGDRDGSIESDETADASDQLDPALTDALRRLVIGSHLVADKSGDRPHDELRDAMLHPQQQAYLLLAGATRAARRRDGELPDLLYPLLRSSPHRFGVTPVGSLSTPISTMWQVAEALFDPTPSGISLITDVLVALSRRYQESARLAMVNEYLWRNAAAPVDVGNFDMAALTLSAVEVYRSDALEVIADQLDRLRSEQDALARSQLEIALEVASAGAG